MIMEGGVRRKLLAKMIPDSRSLLGVTLCLVAIRLTDPGIDTCGLMKLFAAFHWEVSSGESDVINC